MPRAEQPEVWMSMLYLLVTLAQLKALVADVAPERHLSCVYHFVVVEVVLVHKLLATHVTRSGLPKVH